MRGVVSMLLLLAATEAAAQKVRPVDGPVFSARLTQPTNRYDHGVLGDALEWGGMDLSIDVCFGCATRNLRELSITLPRNRVFEDVEARVGDFDGDGKSEVMVVETDLTLGASLAIYDAGGKRAATPFIGQRHRWLAPVGSGDFDGDGSPEIAYVDRPHLLRELVFLQYRNGELVEIARLPGVTNHRIGDARISGGTRRCDGKTEVIAASADWTRVLAITLVGLTPVAHDVGPISDDASLSRALRCDG